MDRHALRDALEAEYLAATLRSPNDFCGAETRVSCEALDVYARGRAEALRNALSGSAADVQWSFEQIEERRISATPASDPVRVVSILFAYARRLLQLDGSEIILRVDAVDPGREILRWRFTSLAVPPVILIAAATPMGIVPPANVRLLHNAMAPAGPVAHQHVHQTALLSFEAAWAELRVRALLHPESFFEGFNERALCPGLHAGRCIGGRGRADRELARRYPHQHKKHITEWAAMVRLAFFARDLLDDHLRHAGPLAACRSCAEGRRSVTPLITGRTVAYTESAKEYPWPSHLIALERHRQRHANRGGTRVHSPSERDFASCLTASERILLVRSFDRLNPSRNDSADPLYEKIFLQYLRVKTAVFGLLVHPPGEPGLENFLDHFKQIKVYVPDADKRLPQTPREYGLNVRAIEYRVAPDGWFDTLRRLERHRSGLTVRDVGCERGWLIHFQRKSPDDGLPLYGSVVSAMEADFARIERSLTSNPQQLRNLRGIDLCGVEDSQPCWVSADTLRRLRQRSAAIAAKSGRRDLQPLRLTLHAGEDFQWLTSGVRAIAEPFIWKLFRRGDRLGHGIAITHEPEGWWERKSQEVIAVTRFDRLLDLAFLAEYTSRLTRDQHEWLRVSLTDLITAIGLEPRLTRAASVAIDVDVVGTARALWRALGTPVVRHIMQSRNFATAGTQDHLQWLHRYFWTPSIQARAHDKLLMRLEDDRGSTMIDEERNELRLLIAARKTVIRQLARWQICIESNPSSNLTVGSLESMLAQTSIHRRSTTPSDHEEETLTWTISTDDPITFSTNLSDEYAYAWAGMVLRQHLQYDPAHARMMLDEAAATSMRTRFTIPVDEDKRRDNERGRRRKRRG